jgi:hypothetical protein
MSALDAVTVTKFCELCCWTHEVWSAHQAFAEQSAALSGARDRALASRFIGSA